MSYECMYAWIRKSDLERCNADLDRLETEDTKLRELAAEAIRLMQANAPDCGL